MGLLTPCHVIAIDNTTYTTRCYQYHTVLANAPVQVHLLFRTGKNIGHTGEFWLFRPVNGYWAETQNAVSFFFFFWVIVAVF